MNHPYDEKDERRSRAGGRTAGNSDWDAAISEVVQAGAEAGSAVLEGISDVLSSLGSSLGLGGEDKPVDFAKWRRRLDRKLRTDHQDGGLALAIVGSTFAFSFGVAALVMWILAIVGPEALNLTYETYQVFPILGGVFTPLTVGFGFMTAAGIKSFRYYGRLRKYLRAAHDWVCSVPALARASLTEEKTVRQDLARAIADGRLPGVCLSEDGQTLYLDEALYQPQPAAPDPEPQAAPPEPQSEEGTAFLHHLRSCRGKLGPQTDEELVRMEKTCAAILAFARNHPDRAPQLRRFREYYLPTTRKLLDTALGLGSAEVTNAQTIRRDITGILQTLNQAYDTLYDTLLQDVSLDVSTEIDTLEAMLRQDGLTHDFAADFGSAKG